MRLLPDARNIFWKAWSIRASFAIALVNGFLVGFAVFDDMVPPYWFLAVNVAGPLLVVLLRLLDQGAAHD